MNKDSDFNQKKLGVGHRIRVAITLTGLRINEFCKKTGFPSGTLWGWETEHFPLTEKGALRLCEYLSVLGVQCSREWLLSGIGVSPFTNSSPSEKDKNINHVITNDKLLPQISIMKEVEFFLSLNNKHTVIVVRDDSMIPFYEPGDFVGGIILDKKDFIKSVNRNCIVTIQNDVSLIRKVNKGNKKGLYTLTCFNVVTKSKNQLLVDIPLIEVAIIIWHRKKIINQ